MKLVSLVSKPSVWDHLGTRRGHAGDSANKELRVYFTYGSHAQLCCHKTMVVSSPMVIRFLTEKLVAGVVLPTPSANACGNSQEINGHAGDRLKWF